MALKRENGGYYLKINQGTKEVMCKCKGEHKQL